ncbi:MAG TPA: FxsA family protein [Myxococcales bacterium]
MGKLLLLLFTVLPPLEIYLLISVGRRLGPLPTVGLVLLSGVLGAFLAKREGLRVLRDYQRTLAEGRVPAEGLLGAVLALAGGLLLIAPGLITDVIGLLLLLPPSRRLAVRVLRRRLERAHQSGAVHVTTFGFAGRGARSAAPRDRRDLDGLPRPRSGPTRATADISDAEIVDPKDE